jgi:MFS family permease
MSASRNRWLVVGAAAVAIFLAMLDASIVNVALPAIGGDLGVDPARSQWVVLGYLLAVAAVVLPAGRWLDSVGRRSALVFAIVGFAVSSALAGAAPDFASLIAARVIQGVFGAVILALVPALVAGAVSPSERGRAIGVVATVGPLGSVCGPPLGGLLVAAVGWRSIFVVNLPVTAALLVLVLATMDRDQRLRLPGREWLAQAALLGSAVLAAMLALSRAASGTPAWLLLLAPAGALTAAWCARPASRPIVAVLRRPAVGSALVALTLIAAATSALQFLAPFYLQRVLGQTPTTTGLVILAFPAAMAACGLIAGAAADRIGPRRVAVAGALVLGVGLALTLPLKPDWDPLDLAWRLGVVGIGVGLFNGPNQTAIIAGAAAGERATASAASGLARSLAFSGGPLLATTAWAASGYQAAGMRIGLGLAFALCVAAALLAAGVLRAGHSEQAAVARSAARRHHAMSGHSMAA